MSKSPWLQYVFCAPVRSILSTIVTLPIGLLLCCFWFSLIGFSSIVRKVVVWTRPLWDLATPRLPAKCVQVLHKIWLSQFKASDVVGHKIEGSTDKIPRFLKHSTWGNHRWMTTSDNVSLHYVIKGPPASSAQNSKKLLVCLHGFPEFWYGMRPFLQGFSHEFTVVALDMRGYGESDKPKANWFDSSNYHISRLAADVNELIEHVGFSKAHIVAHDWGGAIAWMVAHEYEHRVAKMVIMAGPHPKAFFGNISLRQTLNSWYIFFFQAPLLPIALLKKHEAYRLAWQPFQGMLNGMVESEEFSVNDLEAYTWNASQPDFPVSSISYYRSIIRGDALLMELPQISIETLLLIPTNDNALDPSVYRGVEVLCKNLKVKNFANCSHWMLFDAPNEVLQECAGFFGTRYTQDSHKEASSRSVNSRLQELLHKSVKHHKSE